MLAGDADGVDAASVTVLVVCLAGLGVVVDSVDFDDDGAAVAYDGEVRVAHARIAEPGPGQRQYDEGVP